MVKFSPIGILNQSASSSHLSPLLFSASSKSPFSHKYLNNDRCSTTIYEGKKEIVTVTRTESSKLWKKKKNDDAIPFQQILH